jgi:hypothetical protein
MPVNLEMIESANNEGVQDPNDVDDMIKELRSWRATFSAYDLAANARPYDIEAADAAGDLYDKLRALLPAGAESEPTS